MNQYCHFHPTSPAKWRCNKCSRFYDNVCLPKANEKQQQGSCPFCESPLKYLPTEFLSNNSDFYPFKNLIKDSVTSTHLYLLITSLVISLISSLVDINSTLKILMCFTGVLFINLHFARASAYYNHSILKTGRRLASNKRRNNKSEFSMLSPLTSVQLCLVSLLFLLFPVYTFYSLSWIIGLLLIVIGSAAFPFLIIFSLHSSDTHPGVSLSKLFKELKPFSFKLARQSLYLFWLVLFISDLAMLLAPFMIAVSISAISSTLALFIILNVSTKTFMFNIAKLAAQQEAIQAPKGPPSIYNHEKISTLDTDIDQALKTGQYLKVVSLLEEALKRNGNSNLRRQQLFLLLSELQDFEKLSRYAGLFLYWMLERNKIKEASQFLYKLRKHNPAFLLHDLSLMSKLAKQFLRLKKYALVLWLAEEAKTRNKPSEELASLYLSGAQALITHYKDLEKAETYLLFIFQTCAEYPSAEAAKALLIHLQNNQKKQQDLRD